MCIYTYIYMYINLKTLFIVNFSINFPCTMGHHFLFSPPHRARNETSEMRLKLIDFGWFNQIGSRSFDLAVGSA